MAAFSADQHIVHSRELQSPIQRDDDNTDAGDCTLNHTAWVARAAPALAADVEMDLALHHHGANEAAKSAAADAQPMAYPSANNMDKYSWKNKNTQKEVDETSQSVVCGTQTGSVFVRQSHSDVSQQVVALTESSWRPSFDLLPNEVLFHILGFLDVCDLLSTSRVNHQLRSVSINPSLHHYRLRQTRHILPPLLCSPRRPSVDDLISRQIILTPNSIISRRLARSFASIRLARRLAQRPSPETLVQRAVLPRECVPGLSTVHVAPGLVARRKTVEKERLKDTLRHWVEAKWRREVHEREEGVRQLDERRGVGRVWRLTRYWERVSRGDSQATR